MYNNIDMERMDFWDVLTGGNRSNSGGCAGMKLRKLGDAIGEALEEVPGGDNTTEYSGVGAESDVQADGGGAGTSIVDDVVVPAGSVCNKIVGVGDAVDGLDGGNSGAVSTDSIVDTVLPSTTHNVRKQA